MTDLQNAIDLTQPQAVEVKPLVWIEVTKGFYRATYAPGQCYEIMGPERDCNLVHMTHGSGSTTPGFPSVAAAKADADANNRARILSQITTRSVDDVLEQAAQRIEDEGYHGAFTPPDAGKLEKQIAWSAKAIRALKSQPDQAGADPQGNQSQAQQSLAETAVPAAKEISPQRDPTNPFAPLDNPGWLDVAPAPAQDEAVQRLLEAAKAWWVERIPRDQAERDLCAALAAMEGR